MHGQCRVHVTGECYHLTPQVGNSNSGDPILCLQTQRGIHSAGRTGIDSRKCLRVLDRGPSQDTHNGRFFHHEVAGVDLHVTATAHHGNDATPCQYTQVAAKVHVC